MKFNFLLACFLCISVMSQAQVISTGGNSCVIRIETSSTEYKYNSNEMNGRLNEALGRLEFSIPIRSLMAPRDSSDRSLLRLLAKGEDEDFMTINMKLPDDKDPELDLSYFKGNRSINLPGEVHIGKLMFREDVEFNGLLMNNNQTLVFDFDLLSNIRQDSIPGNIGDEPIIAIEIAARGDKILGFIEK